MAGDVAVREWPCLMSVSAPIAVHSGRAVRRLFDAAQESLHPKKSFWYQNTCIGLI
jgi:hypothetical protein